MTEVKVLIEGNNRLVAAMARGLSGALDGHQSVSEATDDFLLRNGFLVFRLRCEHRATKLRRAVREYLGSHGAHVLP